MAAAPGDAASVDRFLAIGLDKKRAEDTSKNPKLSELLTALLNHVSVEKCDKSLGNLIYAVATELRPSSESHRLLAARLVASGKVSTRQQALELFRYLEKISPEIRISEDDGNLLEACGVGVKISEEEVRREVGKVVSEHPGASSVGEIMKFVKSVTALKWADASLVRQVVEELKPSAATSPTAEAPKIKAPKKVSASVVSAAQGAATTWDEEKSAALRRMWLRECVGMAGKVVWVGGWVSTARPGKKGMVFVELRDGTGCVQVVINAPQEVIESSGVLIREASLDVVGELREFPKGHHAPSAEPRTLDMELHATSWRVVGRSSQELEELGLTKDADVPHRLEFRHLVLRSPRGNTFLRVRSAVLHAFREYYQSHDFVEVTPPTIVETFCEGGSDLFKVDYFGEPAYLTQSSQLYLETVLPVVGSTYCILPSFRAEQSRTRRHLSEYTHLEAEMPFISFDDLLSHLEDLVCSVCEATYARVGDLIRFHSSTLAEETKRAIPEFKVPQKPFLRMSYRDAIKYCNEHGILNSENGKPFVYGDDIKEKSERAMTDMVGRPIFMTRFPAEMKAFYMKRCADDPTETESVDLLMPGVGEIVGGSMRIHDPEELLAGYKRVGIDPKPYYWFTDQRKYGTVPHGGYGIGTERFLMWLLGEDHIRELCLYPRYIGLCSP